MHAWVRACMSGITLQYSNGGAAVIGNISAEMDIKVGPFIDRTAHALNESGLPSLTTALVPSRLCSTECTNSVSVCVCVCVCMCVYACVGARVHEWYNLAILQWRCGGYWQYICGNGH
eukprot:TRINITY_DN71098_c0_g1_i1.p1 TRINITY_DN71098_c0_g1~~TRINITY_DN71098_c0_g1_i1.p1  ORF type:complete len:118 (+),score=2.72 TRINITY_DN71098_c0_g1_i1:403-756(+)